MVKLLVKYGSAVANANHGTFYRVYETARYFLENGADPNYRNWLGISSLYLIADEGDVDRAGLLLDFGAEINALEPEYCATALGLASRAAHREMVEFLLALGADPNLPKEEPRATPLAWAVKKGHAEIARILRRHGAT